MDKDKSNAFVTGLYQGAQIVAGYMKDRSSLIEGVISKPETGHRDSSLKGLWLRSFAWMRSLETLNHTRHFQAISAGNRALLEITVDIILLHHDKTNALGWKIFQWGISERMKSAEQVVDFYAKKGVPVPDEYKALETLYKNEKSIVDHMRRTLWPLKKNPAKAEHPKRWTGSSDLSIDVEEADRLYGAEIEAELGVRLLEYYRTEYRKMNWQIHSGIAGFWNVPPEGFNIICGLALNWCANLGMLCTKIVLKDFGYNTALDGLSQEWENIKLQRAQAYAEVQGKFNEGGEDNDTRA